mmetsp:Transcript_11068/g.16615  ORF Transcript_11068/g.16615 Transcript_11068/m.16615 type:complete len:389 (-) Transcript_11068:376-1542(-)
MKLSNINIMARSCRLIKLLSIILLFKFALSFHLPPKHFYANKKMNGIAAPFEPFTTCMFSRQQKKTSSSDDVFDEIAEDMIIETIAGGSNTIFQHITQSAMRMVWRPFVPPDSSVAASRMSQQQQSNPVYFDNSNPDFRNKSPEMTQEGYALTMTKNVRKRNKPSLWRYALATYNKMQVPKLNVHHQAALTACAKLGLYREALEILLNVSKESRINADIKVTESMIASVVKSCVRGSRSMGDEDDQMRILNYARSVVLKSERAYGVPLSSHLINPLVARYQKLGHYKEASLLLNALSERTNGMNGLNINDFAAKDVGSYGLIVQEAVANENWSDAILALKNMTDIGVYPGERQMNNWNEVAVKNSRSRRKEYLTSSSSADIIQCDEHV